MIANILQHACKVEYNGKCAYNSALAPNSEHPFISYWISGAHSNLRDKYGGYSLVACAQNTQELIVLCNFGSMEKENDELRQKLTEERKMWVKIVIIFYIV